MASGVVRGAISTVLDDEKLVQSARTDAMRQFGKNLLAKVMDGDQEMEIFDKFCEELTSRIDSIFSKVTHIVTPSSKRTLCWHTFHEQRLKNLPELWQNMFVKLGFDENHLLMQSVNQELFQQMLSSYFARECTSIRASDKQVVLTPDELNAMQYACGYVPHKLL